ADGHRARQAADRRPRPPRQPVRHRVVHRLRAAVHGDRLPRASAAARRISGVRSLMKRLAAAIALLAPMPAGAGTPADYAVLFALDTPGDEPAWHIELTPDVYARIHDAALRDLEVFNAAGQPVPSALLPASPATSRPRETALPLFRIPATPAG